MLLLVLALPLGAQKTHEYCAACHGEQVEQFSSHKHFRAGLNCDACHGASVAHRGSTGGVAPDRIAAPEEVPALCGACHTAPRKEFAASKHGKLVLAKAKAANCATCHGVHGLRTAPQREAQCARCHTGLPASCKARTACASCHAGHTLVVRR